MAQQIQGYLKEQMPVWRETHPGAEDLRVAVMGCVVNGPGESKHADIGISLPGTFEEPVAPVFIDGRLDRTLRGDGLVAEFIDILEDYVAPPLPGRGRSPPAARLAAGVDERALAAREGPVLSRPRSRVYTSGQLNGRSATWVTPTFLFERRREHLHSERRPS